MSPTGETASATEPFRLFRVRVRRARRLSPSFTRVTFVGEDLDRFADNGFDQRIKLVLPQAGRGLVDLPEGPGSYARWRRLPRDQRCPMRTYTARAVRPDLREVDLDMVLHGETGPASRFALHARPGHEAALVGPDALFAGRHGGVEFAPPVGHDGQVLLAGDETAAPALAGILERLPPETRGAVVLEVPVAADRLPLDPPPGLRVTWAVRAGSEHGRPLEVAVRRVVARIGPPPTAGGCSPDPSDPTAATPLWDVPDRVGRDAAPPIPLYAWIAGESASVRRLRRHLLGDLGHDRRAIAFMGYWRHGRPGA